MREVSGSDRGGGTVSGLDPNVAATLSYALLWITGLIFYLIEKDNRYVRFHALQSIFFSIAVLVVFGGLGAFLALFQDVPVVNIIMGTLGSLVSFLLRIAVFAVWIMLMVRAYRGERYKLPVVGDMAEQVS